MNIRDLQYIVAVAEHQHFGKAADVCFVSQPTLSGQIKKLEEELDIVLFERTNKKVDVTIEGMQIIEHARQILEQVDTIRNYAQSHTDPMAGNLRIGMIPTIAPYLVPLILGPVKNDYPQTRLMLSEEITDHLNAQLLDRKIDLAILATPVTHPELECIELYDEPFWLAHHRSHSLYNQDTITDEDLSQLDLLLLDDGHCLTRQVMNVCGLGSREDKAHSEDLRASSLETLLQLVAAGYGTTLIPALAIRGSWMTDMGIIARQIDSTNASRRVSLVYRASYPKKAIVDILGNIIQKHLTNTVTKIMR